MDSFWRNNNEIKISPPFGLSRANHKNVPIRVWAIDPSRSGPEQDYLGGFIEEQARVNAMACKHMVYVARQRDRCCH
jgi:hypothetical protein